MPCVRRNAGETLLLRLGWKPGHGLGPRRLRPARGDEDALKTRFGVVVMPSLVVTRGGEPLAVIAKIRDWSEYVERIRACLIEGAPALKPGAGPKTEIRYSRQRTSA